MPNKRDAKSDFVRISNQRVDQLSNLSVSCRPLCRGQRQCDDIWTVRSTSSALRVSSNPISQRPVHPTRGHMHSASRISRDSLFTSKAMR